MLFRLCCLGVCGWLGLQPCLAQTPADTVARQLDNQLRQLRVSPLLRVMQVRDELKQELRHDRTARLPGLLDYLAQRVPGIEAEARLVGLERSLLLLAAGRFPAFLDQTVATAAANANRSHKYFQQVPIADSLLQVTQAYLHRHLANLALQARQARLPAEDSAFLQLDLQLLTIPTHYPSDTLNAQLLAFLQRYPASRYTAVLDRVVRYEWVSSPFTFGAALYGGTTKYQGALHTAFAPSFFMGGIGLEAGWKRWQLLTVIHGTSVRPRAVYEFDGTVWQPEVQLNGNLLELLAGYQVVGRGRFRLMPYAGISHFYLTPTTDKGRVPADIDRTLRFARPFTAGVSADFRFENTREYAWSPHGYHPSGGAVFVRLRAGWRAAEARSEPTTRGNIYFLEMGLGLSGRGTGHFNK